MSRTITISKPIEEGIVKLSDELKLNELECLNLWCVASDSTQRRWLEHQLQYPAQSLEDIPTAAMEFYFYERMCLVNSLCELLKARMMSRSSGSKSSMS